MLKNLFIILFMMSVINFGQQFETRILVEGFTNSHCGNCPSAHNALENYLSGSGNSDKVDYVFYHMRYPYSDDSLFIFNQTDSDARDAFYGGYFFTPVTFFNGEEQARNYAEWENILDEKLQQDAILGVELEAESRTDSIKLDIDINTGILPENISPLLFVIVLENVTYSGRNGIVFHKNVMRRILDNSGMSLSLNNSSSMRKSITFPIESKWNLNELSFLVFIQESSTFEVFNSKILKFSEITSLSDQENITADSFELFQNYPNPFNPSTSIRYSVPEAANITIGIYNILGQELLSYSNFHSTAGVYSFSFNGESFGSGVYFYKFESGSYVQTRKMIIQK